MIIGITGYARAGKDTAATVLVKEFGFQRMGFADALRDMATVINPLVEGRRMSGGGVEILRYADLIRRDGYEAAKDAYPEIRRFLQVLGTDAMRDQFGENVWVDTLERKYRAAGYPNVVVPDCRFPNEAAFVTTRGYLWRVKRTGQVLTSSHASETLIDSLSPTWTVTAETVDELTAEIRGKMRALVQPQEAR